MDMGPLGTYQLFAAGGEPIGRILSGPRQVPGGSWILQCMDPQGAMFALVAGKR